MNRLIMPLFYYYKNPTLSDRKWIAQRMKEVPEKLQQEVSNNYDNNYLKPKNGRDTANKYLNGVATEFRIERQNRARDKPKEQIVTPPAIKKKVNNLVNSPVSEFAKFKVAKTRQFKSDDGLWTKKL
ncbi:MAG: hypothetical protein HRU18_23550 [Pseudoalteromonas sp.]|uniref:hypothetical protein n=1 Tax=Pseudoalteromonas sp. TaxID=53249 RepID=UPI001DC73BC4|nr:hypothetical protein [Pseudoalteromonas sp.]NRA81186.1 hypothetical protein [Pseudoalteromonas sp.]